MSIAIHVATGTDELTEFLIFQDRVNEQSGAWWPAIVPMNLPMLQGKDRARPGVDSFRSLLVETASS